MRNKRKLIREQLDNTLRVFEPLRHISPPPKGWIRAIRDALGINGRQLADRMGEHRSRTEQIEQRELTGSVTVKTMKRTAEALDCVFVYGFVPRTSLEQTVRARAEQAAKERLARASGTMALEDQSLTEEENDRVLADMVDEMVDDLPPELWNIS
jgi:predicted DNA-binding mobile mystery protein A